MSDIPQPPIGYGIEYTPPIEEGQVYTYRWHKFERIDLIRAKAVASGAAYDPSYEAVIADAWRHYKENNQ